MSGPHVHHFLEKYVDMLYYEEEPTADVSRKMLQAIEDQAQNLPSQMFSNLISRMVDSGINLLNYDIRDSQYRVVGLVVLDCLLDVNDEIMPERRIEIANQLRKVLENDKQNIETTGIVLRKAADSIGHLARVASTTEIEFLQDFYVANAIKWLSNQRSDAHKFSGVLILEQLALNSPALIYAKRKNFFSAIWDVIFDKNVMVRVAAAESLNAVVVLVSQREPTDEYIRLALHETEIGFNSTAIEKVHGAMLIFDSLLAPSVIPPNDLLTTVRNVSMKLQDLFWDVLQRKDHKDPHIRQKVLVLIPKLASLSQATFIQQNQYTSPLNFLSYSVRHMLDVIYAQKDRATAYIALGNLLVAMAAALKGVNAIIDDVFSAIRAGFKEPFCVEALHCLSVVVRASPAGRGHVDSDLVNAMFQGGLTSALIKSLKAIVKSSPNIRGQVQVRLRSHITNILLNHSVVRDDTAWASPASRRTNSTAVRRTASTSTPPSTLLGGFFSKAPSKRGVGEEPSTDEELVLSLQVLATFDFLPNQFNDTRLRDSSRETTSLQSLAGTSGTFDRGSTFGKSTYQHESEGLLRVVREGVVRYLDDSNPAIRDAAAVTCATVLSKVVEAVEETTSDGGKYLIQVMDRLLMLGVGDESEHIRVHVFLSLPPSLDHIISNSENVHCLIEAMNDESFDVRSAAMSVFARVAHYDTVHVMPLVRLMLSKLMRQLHNSKDILLRQESVQLLQAMVRGTNVLLVPYVSQILEPLLALLDDPSPAIVSAAVSTIGELSLASPEEMEPRLSELFPRLIQALNDQSSLSKQEVSVVAMGKIVSSLNIVSTPYSLYPSLFESLVKAIQRPEVAAVSLRLQAIRTIGLLGAVDIEMYQRSLRASGVLTVHQSHTEFDDETDPKDKKETGDKYPGDIDDDDQLVSLDRYYLSVVIGALGNILRDSSLSSHHQTAATVVMRVVRILGFQSDPLLDTIISAYTYRFYNSESGGALQETLLDNLITMVYVVGRDVGRLLDSIVQLTCDYFHVHLTLCLNMVEALCYILLPQDFNGVLRELLPCMVQVTRNEMLQDRDELFNTRTDTVTTDTNAPLSLSAPSKKSSLPKTSKVFTTLANISASLGEYRRQLIPVILKVVELTGIRAETKREALCAVMHLASDSSDLNEFASRIIHPLLRLVCGSEPILQTAALTALSCMVCRLNTSYLPFVIPAKRKISQIHNQRDATAGKIPQLEEYEHLVSLLLKQRPLPVGPSDRSTITIKSTSNISSRLEKCRNVQMSLRVELKALETAWTLSGRTTSSDLVEWMRRLSIELIRQSPSPILRPCAILGKVYQPLAHELFNAAFVSVWDELFSHDSNETYSDIPLISGLETALQSPQIPSNIRQALLNLAEFMDMQDKPLPLDIQVLAKQAAAANMFAKCLHYREIEFNSVNTLPSSECIEALISVNTQLGMREAASGVLKFVHINHRHIKIEPYWLEKLARWQDARESYTQQSKQRKLSVQDPDALSQQDNWIESELGILRCLHALGDYADLCNSANDLKKHVQAAEGQVDSYDSWMTEVQRLGANAAWMLGKWDEMEGFLQGGSLDKHHDVQLENDGSFYDAVLAIHKGDLRRASRLVTETREAVSSNISSLLSESYSRAYRSMVTMQVLSEMEELIDYKKYETKALVNAGLSPEDVVLIRPVSSIASNGHGIDASGGSVVHDILTRRLTLMDKWQRRLKCAAKEVDVYRLILAVHTLLVDPKDDLDSWLDLVSICRKEGMLALCANILKRMGGPESPEGVVESIPPRVVFSAFKYWWERGDCSDALESLTSFIAMLDKRDEGGDVTLKVKCLLKRAEWMQVLFQHDITDSQRQEVLDTVRQARDLASDQYHVWHAWAVINYDQLSVAAGGSSGFVGQNIRSSQLPVPSKLNKQLSLNIPYIVEAVKGFSRSIALGANDGMAHTLQDTLRLLTLWFTYGTRDGVFDVLSSELKNVAAENWLGVLPQMIARMHVKNPEISVLLKELLIKVAINHPQALVYSISVALNTNNSQRKQIATEVMLEMRKHDSQLVEEAAIVSRELMRVAITPHELWHEGLERAAQLYIGEKDIDGMVDTLTELHRSMEHIMAPSSSQSLDYGEDDIEDGIAVVEDIGSSLRDVSFRHLYGRDLFSANEWLKKYKVTRDVLHLHQAWDVYHRVFRQISSQLKSFKQLELRHVSPALTGASNLGLAVPGTYRTRGDVVHIRSFYPSVDIITSKQRPRRMTIVGTDGLEYRFLLKGHEDLRQDERVMQLFGLINVCLDNDRWTRSRGLNIVRYSVLPLSNNSGVIGWVENCDTLNALVKQYREARDVKMNVEHKLTMTKAPCYEKLTVQQKVDVFCQVRDETTGQDLAKMLWLKSKTSDVWVERRSNYTKSLAVMSIVGYILGLGDRHPSNLMLDRVAGRIVHIDFGDCFEVAMQRSKYPETIPFRLTRMLIKAMEISGIEGTFRSTSEKVMSILRANSNSVMAMLEAFVYDPLISWRLLAPDGTGSNVSAPTGGDVVHKAATQTIGTDSPVVGSPSASSEQRNIPASAESQKNVADSNIPKLMRLKSQAINESSQCTLNSRALEVINRIQSKLNGRDFQADGFSTVEEQVDRLIREATSVENLCQVFVGWCPFW
mmetsp:Transcript_26418/g.39200  ORF Transcript_26418/g.39200 Transcript_26418/m.39200 type:complete len:2632 (+) Transcript_26418:19-7914(+)